WACCCQPCRKCPGKQQIKCHGQQLLQRVIKKVKYLLGVVLDREAAGVAGQVRAAALAADSGEAHKDGRALADLVQEPGHRDVKISQQIRLLGLGVLSHIMRDLEVAMGTSTLEADVSRSRKNREGPWRGQHAPGCARGQSEPACQGGGGLASRWGLPDLTK